MQSKWKDAVLEKELNFDRSNQKFTIKVEELDPVEYSDYSILLDEMEEAVRENISTLKSFKTKKLSKKQKEIVSSANKQIVGCLVDLLSMAKIYIDGSKKQFPKNDLKAFIKRVGVNKCITLVFDIYDIGRIKEKDLKK